MFSYFPPLFQKEFSDMHGVKQTQMKFIIVKFAFKKSRFFPASSFSRWLFPLCHSEIVVKKGSVTTRMKYSYCFVWHEFL